MLKQILICMGSFYAQQNFKAKAEFMLQCEASPYRHVAAGRGGWNDTSSYRVSSLLCRIEIVALCVTTIVMHVLCSTQLFHMVVHRENDNICSIFGIKDGFVNNWKLILALLCHLEG